MRAVLGMLAAVGAIGLSGCVTDPYYGGYGTGGGGYSNYGGSLDPSAAANYGEVYLSAGFEDDPYVVNVTSGGELNAAQLGGECVGMVTAAPDFQLSYEAGDYPLTFVASSYGDVTLVINTPDSQWVCDDDSAGENDAEIYFSHPQSGIYDIWVGAYDGDSVDAELLITERD